MKNIIKERPTTKLSGRFERTLRFVDKEDIKDKAMLDVGCGYGQFIFHSLKRGAKKISGIEITEEDLVTIRKYIKDSRLDTKVGNASNIPYNKSSFDTVTAWEVIEHIPVGSENDFFSEVYRVLKKGGSFYISTPFDSIASKYFDPAFWLSGHRHYSEKQLRSFAGKRFSVEKVEIVGGYWSVLSILNMYISKWIFKRKRFFEDFFISRTDAGYLNYKRGVISILIKYKKND